MLLFAGESGTRNTIAELNKVEARTLVGTAEYDLEACIEIAKILDKEIRRSKLVSVKDAGHCMNSDKPEELTGSW